MSARVRTMVVGTHEVRVEEDIVYLIQKGDYTRDDAIKMHAEMGHLLNSIGRVFALVDQSKAGRTDPEARKMIVEWNKKFKASGSAIFGGSVVSRAAATLIVSALRLFAPNTSPVVFKETEAEARAWISAQRARILGVQPATGANAP